LGEKQKTRLKQSVGNYLGSHLDVFFESCLSIKFYLGRFLLGSFT
jgi:hypothetical protein